MTSYDSVSVEEKKYLAELDKRIWDRSKDRFGSVHAFENDKMTASDLEKVEGLIKKYRLPCVLHSGPYGDLSMSICDHSDSLPQEAPYLACIGARHVRKFKTWDEEFDYFAAFTHSDENKKLLVFYKLPEAGDRDRYRY